MYIKIRKGLDLITLQCFLIIPNLVKIYSIKINKAFIDIILGR